MRGLLVVAVLGLVGAVAAIVLAVGSARDPVPGALKDCVRENEATLVRGPEGLQPVRDDLLGRRLVPDGPPRAAGRNEVVILRGTSARVLVLASPRGAQLDVPELGTAVYADPSRYGVVAVERDPMRGVLERCLVGALR